MTDNKLILILAVQKYVLQNQQQKSSEIYRHIESVIGIAKSTFYDWLAVRAAAELKKSEVPIHEVNRRVENIIAAFKAYEEKINTEKQ